MITLFASGEHRNVMFHDLGGGTMVQANQHVIIDHGEAMLLDPGGHKVYSQLFSQLATVVPPKGLKHLFFSHQDPDIVAAANGWLMVTDAQAYASALWMRFIPHFGVDKLVVDRIQPIPDEGMTVQVGQTRVVLLPAHFLHSPGNFQVYDPAAKILYTGDLGASLGCEYTHVTDFASHVPYMQGFHERYLSGTRALKAWVRTVAQLDVEHLVPQHGAILSGKALVTAFVQWIDTLVVGVDRLGEAFPIPR
jgi:flavorubredoxin